MQAQRKGLKSLAHWAIMANLDIDNRDIEERINIPIMLLRQGTPISEISGRDLPSPADIKGEANILLLPYYQEVEKKETNSLATIKSGSDQNKSSTSIGSKIQNVPNQQN